MDDFFTNRGGVLEVSDVCRRLHGGNPQSVAANPSESAKQDDRALILQYLKQGGRTCDELEQLTGLSHQTCSARMTDLKKEKLIHEVGKRRTRSGREAGVFQAL